MKIIITILCFFSFWQVLFAQKSDTLDFYKNIKEQDVVEIMIGFSANEWDNNPLGFIGSNFQRFHIHFSSIKKSIDNPYEYRVSGKTMVKENRCDFEGSITIKTAIVYPFEEAQSGKGGVLTAEVQLHENKNENGSGIISGILTADFILNKAGNILVNDVEIGADGYAGRQFEGKWTSYKTHKSKVCNWGDFRIPSIKGNEDHIDVGDGEFMPNRKYWKNGWENYVTAWHSSLVGIDDENRIEKARVKEQEKWWK